MENTEDDSSSKSKGKANSIKNKNVPSKENKNKNRENTETPGRKDAVEAGQKKFINEIEKTENLIDPGNEHHHHADEKDKNIV